MKGYLLGLKSCYYIRFWAKSQRRCRCITLVWTFIWNTYTETQK